MARTIQLEVRGPIDPNSYDIETADFSHAPPFLTDLSREELQNFIAVASDPKLARTIAQGFACARCRASRELKRHPLLEIKGLTTAVWTDFRGEGKAPQHSLHLSCDVKNESHNPGPHLTTLDVKEEELVINCQRKSVPVTIEL